MTPDERAQKIMLDGLGERLYPQEQHLYETWRAIIADEIRAAIREETLRTLAAALINVDAVVALARAWEHYAVTCQTQGFNISLEVVKSYATRIMEELCATKEQDDA